MRKHNTSKRGDYPCGCGKLFFYYSSLRKHIKKEHRGERLPGTYQA